MATVTPVHYAGVVWCIRIPSGAFVARRNGKVFVTGNSGFPKNRACLKPAYEPILLCRKPGPRSLPLNIDGCRVAPGTPVDGGGNNFDRWRDAEGRGDRPPAHGERTGGHAAGRWPANLVHDGSSEVMEAFAAFGERGGTPGGTVRRSALGRMNDDSWQPKPGVRPGYAGVGTAAQFFYCAKPTQEERGAFNTHPTLKPLELMRFLVRLICPAGGLVLDPFLGSGTTLLACLAEGRRGVGVERGPTYADIARRRVAEFAGVPVADGAGGVVRPTRPSLFATLGE